MPDAPAPNTDNTVALAAHADDSYCALCRRCQMRKKLERRLATRRRGASGRGAEHATAVPRDERPIAELLDYIGADESATNRPSRKARRKRAAAMRRRALAEKDNVVMGAESVGCGSCESENGAEEARVVEGNPSRIEFEYEDEDVDREVEEFRRLLEAAHINRPAVELSR